jgi:glycosyltransferase involved in cell wall biosynthesis
MFGRRAVDNQDVSVLVSAWQRADQIRLALPSVIRQKPGEIVIVDDGSTDDTRAQVEAFKGFPDVDVRYFRREKPEGYSNGSIAKNIALRKCIKKYILISDPEMLHLGEIIEKLKRRKQRAIKEKPKSFVVVGNIHFVNWIGANEFAAMDLLNAPEGCFRVQTNVQSPFIGLFDRADLMAVNGLDERYCDIGCWGYDDVDLMTRLRIYGVGGIIDNTVHAIHLDHEHPPQIATMKAEQGLAIVQEHNKSKEYRANLDRDDWGVLDESTGNM